MILISFCLSCIAFFLQMIPSIRFPLQPFIPWLALLILKCPSKKALWLGLIAGLIMDLYSDLSIGLYPLSYVITIFLLYPQRRRFFYQRPVHLALFSSITSLVASMAQLFFLFLLEDQVKSGLGALFLVDILGKCFLDGLYSFCLLSPLLLCVTFLQKKWSAQNN